ncbi:MAG TPA: heme exporter protein CcmD [Rhizomicrobium sp.]|nr:heme exporter protein CcmD [Rhizomicrobium sp.]
MAHFFAMGGYAAFVWPAYGASFVGLGAMIWLTLRDYGRTKRRLAELERDDRS